MTKLNWWKENGNIKLPEVNNIFSNNLKWINNFINNNNLSNLEKVYYIYQSYLKNEDKNILKNVLNEIENKYSKLELEHSWIWIWIWLLLWKKEDIEKTIKKSFKNCFQVCKDILIDQLSSRSECYAEEDINKYCKLYWIDYDELDDNDPSYKNFMYNATKKSINNINNNNQYIDKIINNDTLNYNLNSKVFDYLSNWEFSKITLKDILLTIFWWFIISDSKDFFKNSNFYFNELSFYENREELKKYIWNNEISYLERSFDPYYWYVNDFYYWIYIDFNLRHE